MSKATHCQLATKLSGSIFLSVKVLLLVLCLLVAFFYIWGNSTQSSRQDAAQLDTERRGDAHDSDNQKTADFSTLALLILRRLGILELTLGLMLVGCVLRRWPTLLDAQPSHVDLHHPLPQGDEAVVQIQPQSAHLQLASVNSCTDPAVTEEREQAVATNSKTSSRTTSTHQKATSSTRANSAHVTCVSNDTITDFKLPSKSAFAQTDLTSEASTSTEMELLGNHFFKMSTSKSYHNMINCALIPDNLDISIKSETASQIKSPAIKLSNTDKFMQFNASNVNECSTSTLSPNSMRCSVTRGLQNNLFQFDVNNTSLTFQPANNDRFSGASVSQSFSNTSSPYSPRKLVTTDMTSENLQLPIDPMKLEACTKILTLPEQETGLDTKNTDQGTCPITSLHHSDRLLLMSNFSAKHANMHLKRYQLKAEQLRNKTENKRKMLGALCVRRNLLTSDLVTMIQLVQSSRQRLDNQRDANKALLKYIEQVLAMDSECGSRTGAVGNKSRIEASKSDKCGFVSDDNNNNCCCISSCRND